MHFFLSLPSVNGLENLNTLLRKFRILLPKWSELPFPEVETAAVFGAHLFWSRAPTAQALCTQQMSLEICVHVFSVLANPAKPQCSGLILGSALGSQHGCWDWWAIQTSSCGSIRPLNWTAGWTTVTQEQSWEWDRDKEASGLYFIQNKKKSSLLFLDCLLVRNDKCEDGKFPKMG